MEKSTIYLITLIIVFLTIFGVTGEYFIYKYYALTATQQAQQAQQAQQQQQQITATNASSTNQQPSGSSENLITSFDFNDPLAVGSISQTSNTIVVAVPPSTDVTKLTPSIEISKYATISPSSDTPQDFTNPVAYTVTAQNGSTQKYVVTVNVVSITKSTEKVITSFALSGFSPEIDGTIDNNAHTVYVVVPDGTDLTKLTPIIEVSDNAAVSPGSGIVQNFTSPVIYTVTDMYGGTQNYTVTVVTESNSG